MVEQKIISSDNSRFAKAGVLFFYESKVLNSSFVHLMKFSAENPRLCKAEKRSDIFALGTFFIGQGEKGKTRQVFQHILQLQQWGAFGFIAAEVEMKRL